MVLSFLLKTDWWRFSLARSAVFFNETAHAAWLDCLSSPFTSTEPQM
jgi:hypothetical protein